MRHGGGQWLTRRAGSHRTGSSSRRIIAHAGTRYSPTATSFSTPGMSPSRSLLAQLQIGYLRRRALPMRKHPSPRACANDASTVVTPVPLPPPTTPTMTTPVPSRRRPSRSAVPDGQLDPDALAGRRAYRWDWQALLRARILDAASPPPGRAGWNSGSPSRLLEHPASGEGRLGARPNAD